MIDVQTHFDGAVTVIRFGKPPANILDKSVTEALTHALETEVGQDTKLVVFQGNGAHFSFGASVEEHQRAQAPGMLHAFHGLFHALARISVPTCALVSGRCLGGGLELAAWCTRIYVTPDARLAQPEIVLGVVAPMASLILPWRVGGGRALEICTTGRNLDAHEAVAIGLATSVTDDLEGAWRSYYTEQLTAKSATSLRFAERCCRLDLLRRMKDDLPELERIYVEELMSTHDANEGIAAFIERRTPQFTNT
jgi:cyclohexa-1,5-dienecarbonyl-CoA hydratase